MTNKEIAKLIANHLFTNGAKQKASRLVLELPSGKNGGGWGEKSVIDAIEKILNKHSKTK